MTELQTLERNRLYGTDSHVHLLSALEDLDDATVGQTVAGFPNSIYQIADHMAFWQDVALARIEGRPYDAGECAADGWCACTRPANAQAWAAKIKQLTAGLRALEKHLDALPDNETVRRNIRMLEGHNSYHLGQIVLLRRILGAWPPPKGGDTW